MERTITRTGAAGVVTLAGAVLLAGCQCGAAPVRKYVETRTEVDLSKEACAPAKAASTVTVIRRTGDACAALPPVGEITVVRNACLRTKMVFVSVRPTDDRCFNVETRNFERPWPWGPYGMGDCGSCW